MNDQKIHKGKKVLLSAYACSPFRGSEPGNGWSWATNLAAFGYQVWCFTNVEDKKEILEAKEKLGFDNLHFVFVELPFELDKKLLDTASKKIYFHYMAWQKIAAKLAIKLHKEVHFDIAHHVTFGSLQQGSFIWKVPGVKKIFGPVGGGQAALPLLKEYFGKWWKTERIRNSISSMGLQFSRNFRNTVLKSDYVLVTNTDTLNMALAVKNCDPKKILFVPDTAVPKVMEKIERVNRVPGIKLKLVWVGRMLPRKGLNLVLDALSYVPPHVDYSLTIVGGGECFPLIDGWIDQYGLDRNRLIVLGQIPFFEVIDEYKKADVFVFCSLRDSYGAQLTEAMAFGLPVVALNIHGVTVGVPDNCGIKVTPVSKEQTVKDIAAAIVKMHDDTAFRLQCSENAYRHSVNNTWENRIKEVTDKFYEGNAG